MPEPDRPQPERPPSSRSALRWHLLALAGVTLAAALTGFVWMPGQRDPDVTGFWATVCRAAGVAGAPDAGGEPQAARPAERRSTGVVLARSMQRPATAEDAIHGATFDRNKCTMCHGAAGSRQAHAPRLTGLQPEVVVKQLTDFQRGDRPNLVMQAMARNLSPREMTQLAAHYSATATAAAAAADADSTAPRPGLGVPALVHVGDPMRNIAPCASCHGGIDRKLGAPRLNGLSADYTAAQLRAFASGARRNDSHAQMRNMARRLSPVEVTQLAVFYAQP